MAEVHKPPQSAKELLERYAAGERNFGPASLSGANLRSADLTGANLRGADLRGANLRGANLSRAELGRADLHGANLSRAELGGADLHDVNLNRAELSSANLNRADLGGADLIGATLIEANLSGAELSSTSLNRADLGGAYLIDANLSGADLTGANLSRANLSRANLSGADLRDANFGQAEIWSTHLADLDLSPLCDADPPIIHAGPSTVDHRAIIQSLRSPNLKDFLQRTGMPEVFVEYMVDCARSLKTDVFKMLQSTFISYGGPDEPFARKLYEALHRNGVTTFFFAEHAEPGKKLHRTMTEGVNKHDRMILVCSRASLDRKGVLNELEKVLEREARDGGASYLIPIRLDDYVFTGWNPPNADVAQAVRDRVVANFEGADTDDARFNEGLRRLIVALKKPDPPKPAPTT